MKQFQRRGHWLVRNWQRNARLQVVMGQMPHLEIGDKGADLREGCQVALEDLQLADRHTRREALSAALPQGIVTAGQNSNALLAFQVKPRLQPQHVRMQGLQRLDNSTGLAVSPELLGGELAGRLFPHRHYDMAARLRQHARHLPADA